MFKQITITTLIVGCAIFEMSGGADFKPGTHRNQGMAETKQAPIPQRPVQRVKFSGADDFEHVPFLSPVIENAAPLAAQTTSHKNPILTQASFTETAQQPTSPRQDFRIVTADRVNLRSGPGTNHDVVDTVTQGTEFILLSQSGDWSHVKAVDAETTVWIANWLISD